MYRNRHRKPRHFKTCLFPHITNEDEKQGECRQRRGDLCFVIGVQTERRVPFVYLQHSVSRLPPRSTSTSRFCFPLWPQIYSTKVSTMMQASGTKCVSSNVSRSRWLFWRYTSLGISKKYQAMPTYAIGKRVT